MQAVLVKVHAVYTKVNARFGEVLTVFVKVHPF